jgi:hypothetical protein
MQALALAARMWHTFQLWDEKPSDERRAKEYESAVRAVSAFTGLSMIQIRVQVVEWRKMYLPTVRRKGRVRS